MNFEFNCVGFFTRMTITIIEKKISIEPQYLYRDLDKHILEKILFVCKDECDKSYGYILNVNKVVKVKDNYISNVDSNAIFIVDIEILSLLPKINDVYSDKVSMIFSGGLFINYKNKIKILIPISSLDDYSYDSTNKILKGPKKTSIKENDTIKVKITGVKYSKKNFSCFGEMTI